MAKEDERSHGQKPELASEKGGTGSKVDSRRRTYELLSRVREPSPKEIKDLKAKGFIPFSIEAKSYFRVVARDSDYFLEGELQYASERTALRDFTPPVMEVALNPGQLALPYSFRKSRAAQLEMIQRYSQDEIEKEFPDAKAIMLPVTAYAQADRAYKQTAGEVLFKTCFARGLDNLRSRAAFVGRNRPNERLSVFDSYAGHGGGDVGSVPAVVFLNPKSGIESRS